MTVRSPDNYIFTEHPVRHDWRRGIVVAAIVTLSSLAAGMATGTIWFGVFATVVLTASLTRYFLPTTYSLTSDGISVRTPLHESRRAWHEFRSCRTSRSAVVLLTRSTPSRLHHHRSLTLPWGPERQRLIDWLAHADVRELSPAPATTIGRAHG